MRQVTLKYNMGPGFEFTWTETGELTKFVENGEDHSSDGEAIDLAMRFLQEKFVNMTADISEAFLMMPLGQKSLAIECNHVVAK